MGRVYRIEFPPGTKLITANGRSTASIISISDRWGKASVTRDLRRLAFELAKEAGIPELRRVRIRAYYLPSDKRKRDSPNVLFFSSKAAIDGIVDLGILPDDSDRYVRSLELLPSDEIVKGGKMVIEVEEADGDGA